MKNSRWQISRVGLVDFWYYDEEEFEFLDGRMLLRGANGSGKSVTMQSFIPLLLDGNMRPERLDPFGSRARKMDNYLLEEGDEREERTGYLYMELKREDNETFLSLGIGLRARKNKKLDSWYFCITDGRRIGKDIFLYKDEEHKIVCTKQELKNRIGESGRVMDTQSEYAQCVNQLLFGFETMEEYREMLELLIQLRTPKLSKEFKPTVVNDILSNSLQTLTEEDLRPMSEAIENMDSLKINLDELDESLRAAKQIERIYRQYNEIVLFEKASVFADAIKECQILEKKLGELQKSIAEKEEEQIKETENYQKLKQEEAVLKEEKESISSSDAALLKEKETQTQAEIQDYSQQTEQKKKQEEEKKERYQEVQSKKEEQEEKNEMLWGQIETQLEEMASEIEDIPFDEAAFFRQELCEAKEKPAAFQAHIQLLDEYKKRVEAGREILEEERICQEKYDRNLKELDVLYEKQKQTERDVLQKENLLHEIKSELIEQIYGWEKQNTELHLSASTLSEMVRFIDGYQLGMDYSEIRDKCKLYFYERERELSREKLVQEQECSVFEMDQKKLEKELTEWKNRKEPEPEISEEVQKNRKMLQEKQIPFTEFYKAVDFEANMSQEQMDRLEEALTSMGLLNALIVSEEYREQIRQLDEGVCDRYLFSDVEHVKDSLIKWLNVDDQDRDILFYQEISNILYAVGNSEAAGSTWIDTKGNYRIGILEGTVSGVERAKYIGSSARAAYKQKKIEELEEQCRMLQQKIDERKERIAHIEGRMRMLEQEWNAFPSDEDLKTAAGDFEQAIYELNNIKRLLQQQQDVTEEERKKLVAIRLRVQEICEKCFLPGRLDIFTDALRSLGIYREYLLEIRSWHGEYRNGLIYVQSQIERLEELDTDLDEIRYERIRYERKLLEAQSRLASILEQLKLTDYEKIRERLDECIRRLTMLPGEIESSARRQESLRSDRTHLNEKLLECAEVLEKQRSRKERLRQAFEKEQHLNYVEHPFGNVEDMEKTAERIRMFFDGKYGNKKQIDLAGSLQESYHQNRGYLTKYQLTIQQIFTELDEDFVQDTVSMKRLEITAKYRGSKIRFPELIEKLTEDAEELRYLLSDKDRELFEDILANTISKKIRAKIHSSRRWVEKMNALMESMQTSSGLKLSLRWKYRRAEKEDQMDTRELVELLQKDVEIMREEEVERLSGHFRSKIAEARTMSSETGSATSFHSIMKEVLDYRKWFEFQLESQKTGEKKKELTDRVFFTFSGGEKAMAMYVPLFSAVVAKYAGARSDAPRLISLDEAFAGVDATNIRDMFRLMVEFEFNFMINSQVLWGDCDTVPALAIYQLVRPLNAKYVTVIPYIWNGKMRILAK